MVDNEENNPEEMVSKGWRTWGIISIITTIIFVIASIFMIWLIIKNRNAARATIDATISNAKDYYNAYKQIHADHKTSPSSPATSIETIPLTKQEGGCNCSITGGCDNNCTTNGKYTKGDGCSYNISGGGSNSSNFLHNLLSR